MNQNTPSDNPSMSADLARRLQENFRGGPANRDPAAQDRPQGQPNPPPGAAPTTAMTPETARAIKDLLRANLGQLEAGLTPTEKGPELEAAGGQHSILARTGAGAHVVIEFNAEEAAMEEFTRTLCQMGALQERVQQPVRGILVARAFPQPVRLAARMVPGLQLKTYSLSLAFGDAAARP